MDDVMDSLWSKGLNGILQTKWDQKYTLFQHLGLYGLEWYLFETAHRNVHLDKGVDCLPISYT